VRYYPLFLDISGRLCVVVGGGSVAERKVGRLLDCGARVEVVASTLTAALGALAGEGRIVHHEEDYHAGRIRGAFLVIGATDSGAVNERISCDARALGILVNIVDQPERCDFILPSVVARGDLAIAVSTSGRSPALARKLRTELEARYGSEYAVLTGLLGELRRKVIASGRTPEENREKFEAVVASDILEHIRANRWGEIRALIKERTGVEMEVGPK
jgi:precorrin-2 dehydrogenase / sirohydrochlorin ferrochelatase